MYTRIINNQPVWPYTLSDLRMSEPNTSFPDTMSAELLAEYQVFSVTIDPEPTTTYQQNAVRQDPVFENGVWTQHWSIVDAPEEIVNDRYGSQVATIREQRNIKLMECDWTQAKDIPDSVSITWQPYRQQLRDVPNQPGFPFAVVWPQQPA